MGKQIVTFMTGGIRFGVDILMVSGMYRNIRSTPIPDAPDFFHGLMNIHGRVVTLVNLNVLLGIAPVEDAGLCRLLVLKTDNELRSIRVRREIDDLHFGNDPAALLIDSAGDVLDVSETDILPPALPLPYKAAELIHGVVSFETGQVVSVLDIPALFERIIIPSGEI